MNRNVLKIIALLTMVIDHIGAFIFPSFIWLRIIGRLSFPIFAFFIAEGIKHTRNRKRYVLVLLLFAVISQIPYAFLMAWWKLNILFTFLIAILIIFLIENLNKKFIVSFISLMITFVLLLCTELFNVFDYGICGILFILIFYFVKSKYIKSVLASFILILLTIKNYCVSGFVVSSLIQFVSIISVILLLFYTGQKGKFNLKYLFYVTYPLHLAIIYIVTLF